MSHLSMPQSRKTIRKQDEVAARLKRELRQHGVTRKAQREKLMLKAAAGRPSDLRQQALASLAARRVQHSLDMIAGTV